MAMGVEGTVWGGQIWSFYAEGTMGGWGAVYGHGCRRHYMGRPDMAMCVVGSVWEDLIWPWIEKALYGGTDMPMDREGTVWGNRYAHGWRRHCI